MMDHCTKNQVNESREEDVHDYLNGAVGIRHCEATEDEEQSGTSLKEILIS